MIKYHQPEESKLNDSVINKSHRDQTQFSPEKKDSKKQKMGFLLSVCSLSFITPTNKQAIYYFNDIQAPSLHTIQCYNIYEENLDQSQNHF